jgi:hypothetical protein
MDKADFVLLLLVGLFSYFIFTAEPEANNNTSRIDSGAGMIYVD